MSTTNTLRRFLEQAWLPFALLALWWVLSSGSTNFYFPPLSVIWETFLDELLTGRMLRNIGASMRNITAGLFIGVLAGVFIGVAIGRSRNLRAVLDPYLQFLRAMPQVALIPIIIGAFGITALPKIWAIAFACVWPVLLNTIDGIRAIDTGTRDMVRSYRINRRLELFKVMLPAALPQIMAGIRVSLSVAVVVMVVSEIWGATEGLGFFINQSGAQFQVAATWAGTLVVGLIGYLLSLIFLFIEHRSLHWYHNSAQQ